MQLRGHGNAVAIALAGLAVVLAASGTAYAVATTKTQITDPKTPSQIARVDSRGRLTMVGAYATINAYVFVGTGPSGVLSPTTASLAITHIGFYNTGKNSVYANTNFGISVVKINAGADGNCYATDAVTVATYSRNRVAVGTSSSVDYETPLLVRATGTKPYCLGVSVTNDDGTTNPTSYYNPTVQITGFVGNGTYSGIGAAASPAAVTRNPLTTPADPHPAGVVRN